MRIRANLPQGTANKILITSSEKIARKICRGLLPLDVEPVVFPCIQIDYETHSKEVSRIIGSIDNYNWIVFTSRNSIEALLINLPYSKKILQKYRGRIAVIGPATAELAEKNDIAVHLVSQRSTTESLVESFRSIDPKKQSVLLLQGSLATPELFTQLKSQKFSVSRVVTYRTEEKVSNPHLLRRQIDSGGFLSIVITSGSAGRALKKELGDDVFCQQNYICIGPTTENEMAKIGAKKITVATPHSALGIIEAIRVLLLE